MINTNLLNYYENLLESENYKHNNLSIADLIRSETGINYNIVPQKAPIWVREQLISCPTNYLTSINNGTLFAQAIIPVDLTVGKGLQNVYLFRIWYLAQNEKLNFDKLPENAVEYKTIAKRMPSYKPEKKEENYCEICGEYWLDLAYHRMLNRCYIYKIKESIKKFQEINKKNELIEITKTGKKTKEILHALNKTYQLYNPKEICSYESSKDPCQYVYQSIEPAEPANFYTTKKLLNIVQMLNKHKYKPKQIIELLQQGEDHYSVQNVLNECRLKEV